MNNQIASQVLVFVVPIAIIYFIILRPQQQQKRKHEEALLGIKKGDEIITSGGLIGDVIYIKTAKSDGTASLDDRLTVKSGESRLIVERGRIARISPAATAGAPVPAKTPASSSAV
jgi:preprotein translocase subunit YajC